MTDEEIMDAKPRQTLEDLRAAYDAQQEQWERERPERARRLAERRLADAAEWERRAELNQQRRDLQRRYPGLSPVRVRFQ